MHRLNLRTLVATLSVMFVMALAVAGFGIAQAQDDDVTVDGPGTPRPGHIHAGSCVDGGLGDVVFPLNNATIDNLQEDAEEGTAEFQGSENATPVYVSETVLSDVTLDDILAEPHAINFHLSTDELETYITCGEIGGFERDGVFFVGLTPVEGSDGPQFAGSAILTENGDGSVTVLITFVQVADAATGGGSVATPAATPAVIDTESAEPSAVESVAPSVEPVPSEDGSVAPVPSADESVEPVPSDDGGESVEPVPSDDEESSAAPSLAA
ncbi:MAG TPA: hypothetical protein VGT61_12405 [Thermomicrobiales bacterium]|nr:hypothetical protein [Thermomicrobiales bacterium]